MLNPSAKCAFSMKPLAKRQSPPSKLAACSQAAAKKFPLKPLIPTAKNCLWASKGPGLPPSS
ncbi:oxysterol-binding protein [Histoplasma ohiense]|nr:oxysterol-binding protein [Histoplasma ohiense (nom. inval.)]